MIKQSKSLFDLTEEQLRILNQIEEVAEETEGDIPDELWDTLIISKEELKDKVAAYVFRIAELEGQHSTLCDQAQSWMAKAERKQRAITFLKAGLAEVSKRLGTKNEKGNYSLQAGEIKVNYQFTHPVEIENEEDVPDEFKKYDAIISNLTKKEYDRLINILSLQDDIEILIIKEPIVKISKPAIKNAIETAVDKKQTNEFTISETVPGAFIDNQKGFIRIY